MYAERTRYCFLPPRPSRTTRWVYSPDGPPCGQGVMMRRGLKRRRGLSKNRVYARLDQDEYGGMNPTGIIIRDAWLFDILPEEETGAGGGGGRGRAGGDQGEQ